MGEPIKLKGYEMTPEELFKLIHDEADFGENGDFHNNESLQNRINIMQGSFDEIKIYCKKYLEGDRLTS